MDKRNNSEGREVWESRITEQRASGLSQKDWCAKEKVSVNTFQSWIKRLGLQVVKKPPAKKESRTFVEAYVTGAPGHLPKETGAPSGIELSVIRLRLPLDYDKETLCEIIEEAWAK